MSTKAFINGKLAEYDMSIPTESIHWDNIEVDEQEWKYIGSGYIYSVEDKKLDLNLGHQYFYNKTEKEK